mmetsp:Transcript_107103/g.341811  ORF Transcript_107103/g.341811 Transcript_107103/m.341811 type:complete len:227 (-) Transcript_107103:121-801(-)
MRGPDRLRHGQRCDRLGLPDVCRHEHHCRQQQQNRHVPRPGLGHGKLAGLLREEVSGAASAARHAGAVRHPGLFAAVGQHLGQRHRRQRVFAHNFLQWFAGPVASGRLPRGPRPDSGRAQDTLGRASLGLARQEPGRPSVRARCACEGEGAHAEVVAPQPHGCQSGDRCLMVKTTIDFESHFGAPEIRTFSWAHDFEALALLAMSVRRHDRGTPGPGSSDGWCLPA